MELENSPSLPNAHQQIRLGDLQASAQKWTAAIEYYSRAIEYFKAIQNTLHDASLISILQAQIVQCEKAIHFYRLKDRSEQAMKAERNHKVPHVHSAPSIRPDIPSLQNAAESDGRGGMDSLSAMIFPNHRRNTTEIPTKNPSTMMAKKTKNEQQKMEELQMNNEAMKNHLKDAYDDIERLKHENSTLRAQKEVNSPQEQVVFQLLPTNHEDDDEEKNELENTT